MNSELLIYDKSKLAPVSRRPTCCFIVRAASSRACFYAFQCYNQRWFCKSVTSTQVAASRNFRHHETIDQLLGGTELMAAFVVNCTVGNNERLWRSMADHGR